MAKMAKLEAYTKAQAELEAFKAKHKKVFSDYADTLLTVEKAEKDLKEWVKSEVKRDVCNDFFVAKYSQPYSRGFKGDVILSMVTSKEKKALVEYGALKVVEQVDGKGFEELCDRGEIRAEVKQAAFFEEELSPRVSISEVKKYG